MEKHKRQLRNYVINFAIQRKVVVINLIFMLLVMIMTMAVMRTHMLGNIMEPIFQYRIGSLTFSLPGEIFIILAATFFFGIVAQLWITHRVCGALVNFVNTFKGIGDGDLGRKITLRKGDLLEKEAEQFNRMMEKIVQRVAALEMDNERLRLKIKALSEGCTDG
ncbi:MAG: hypothetical protein ABIK98_14400 [Pseudomonadota bacterium]|uniref:HAMP domain-containing protein n=1 Tax=Candidatus Desulfatibia profunda TaxID=2841695 RepID=A0A8J6NX81_9BACT|nr:hypothetical protein [Candidatus Desulfatibia profunda]MBL7173480.1 hypothetical protein [Desulfobacteraceae bacterium]MBL7179664.1 hypothetical protein [Desulfobacterales bacterium]MBU0698836.1 hypothetical protein [Pseudomonadota bacterium]